MSFFSKVLNGAGDKISAGASSIGQSAGNIGQNVANNISTAGNNASNFMAGMNRYSNQEMERGVGSATYDTFDPRMSMNFKGMSMQHPFNGNTAIHNPWGAARLAGAGVGAAVMAPFMLAGLGAPAAAGVVGANAGLYHNYAEHDRRLKEREKWDAYRARNASYANSGVSGVNGNITQANAAQGVQAVLAHYAAMRQAAQQQYEASVLDQLQSFMSMAGNGFGGNGGPLAFLNGGNTSGGGY